MTEVRDFALVQTAAPLECVPCRFCKRTDQLYAELPVKGDWFGRGFVMRIGCVCSMSCATGDKDDARTDFERYAEAIAAWNDMQRHLDSGE